MKKISVKKVLISILPALLNFRTIIITFGIFLIGCIWISFYDKIENEKQIEIKNAIKETDNLARAFEEHMSRTINGADQAVLFLKYQYEKEGQTISIPQYIREGRFSNLPFVLMGVIDEKGDFVVSNQVPFISSNLKDREHFLVHKEIDSGGLFISKPVLGRSSGKWSMQFTRRINKLDGTFGGVAVVSVDPFYFTEFYKQVDLGKNSSVTLVGRDGFIRARLSGDNADVGQDLNNGNLMEKLSGSNEGNYVSKSMVDGIERIYSYRALRNYPLAVVVGVDKDVVFQSLNKRIDGYYKVAWLITFVTCTFILLLLHIASKQKRTEEKLKQAHDEMEAKVNLRTQELFNVNKELAATNKEFQKANQELEDEVSERKRIEKILCQKNEDIRKMAYTDILTGLPNRAYFKERLELEMEKARRGEVSGLVMFIDLDDLKSVNDVFGHTQGDFLIFMAGTRIVEALGNQALVARIGGDEFVVLLPGESDRNRIASIVDQIIRSFATKFEVEGDMFYISASIGVAVYPTDGDTTEEILKNADCAMYAAKKGGKKCWRFYKAEMQTEVSEKMLLTNKLRHAIELGEMFLHYQPQVDPGDQTVIGFEALLRWKSPEVGMVSPVRFIPLAEQSGLIITIGQWVLRQACQFARKLADRGWGDIYVAVNISPLQLVADDFISIVCDALKEADIEPCQLELEITENNLIASMEEGIRKLNDLRTMGVRVSLDDFGKGYSSLTYLRSLPVETLKIDKSFIDMIRKENAQEQIIGSIIQMAHIFQMKVIAEGVETEQQLAYLMDNHCDGIQGYIISPPVSEKKAIEILEIRGQNS